MSMEKIKIEDVKEISEKHNLKPCKIKGKDVINIRKEQNENLEDISWEEFESILNKKNLAVYKSNNDWLKIMKKK